MEREIRTRSSRRGRRERAGRIDEQSGPYPGFQAPSPSPSLSLSLSLVFFSSSSLLCRGNCTLPRPTADAATSNTRSDAQLCGRADERVSFASALAVCAPHTTSTVASQPPPASLFLSFSPASPRLSGREPRSTHGYPPR